MSGLRANALGLRLVSTIGVASAAPGYSLAAALGVVALAAGTGLPATLLLAFLPMAGIACAFDQFNRIDPDCGTVFAWVSRAFGPTWGWLTGWTVIAADVVVMASLAQVAAQYALALFGCSAAQHPLLAQAVGVGWIAAMTWLCSRGIAFSARLQGALLLLELIVLVVLAAVLLRTVYAAPWPQSAPPSLAWFWPGNLSARALLDALGVAIFLYWGWDTALNVNAESHNPQRTPGRAALLATLVLLAVFLFVATAAVAWRGPTFLAAHPDDALAALAAEAFAAPWDKLLAVVVLTSAVAATQTTILPTARTALSMAQKGVLPQVFATIHPVQQVPTHATLWMGAVSVAWYLALAQLTPRVGAVSLQALDLLVAFYYGLTGFACAWHFRRNAATPLLFVLRIAAPLASGLALLAVMAGLVLWPSGAVEGVGPLAVAMAFALLLLGFVLLLAQRRASPAAAFWRGR